MTLIFYLYPKALFVTIILILFTLYIYARQREDNRMTQPRIRPTNDQRMIYPSNTSTLPTYPNIAEQKENVTDSILFLNTSSSLFSHSNFGRVCSCIRTCLFDK